MPTSNTVEARREAPKNAFDLMMGKDKSVLRYKGFRALGSDVYSIYAALADLLADIACEEDNLRWDIPSFDYDEFYERYWPRVVGFVSEAEFYAFWEEVDWEMWLADGLLLLDEYNPASGPGLILTDVDYDPEVSVRRPDGQILEAAPTFVP